MGYTIRGQVTGALCDDCFEPLTGVIVRFYAAEKNEEAAARAAADNKDTVERLDDAAMAAKASRLVAEATVDTDGKFAAELASSYTGGLLDVDFTCGTLPGHPRPHHERVTLHVTTFAPRWREVEGGFEAAYVESLSARIWCWLKALLGWWTICGHVVFCEGKEPVPGATVSAYDVDWIQDDALGSAVTDGSGHFRIDYTSADFKRTPWSPFINFELVGGPDVYFRVTAPGGSVLLNEPRSKGRTPGRQNIGPCFCVDLCIDGKVPPTPPTVPVFTNVGVYAVDPLVGDFASDGTTSVGGKAFTSTLTLNGVMPDPLSSQAIDYRFLVAQHPALVDQPLTGAALPATQIGILEYYFWNGIAATFATTPFYVNNPGATVTIPQNGGPAKVVPVNVDAASDGWIAAPRLNELFLGGRGRFQPTFPLAKLETSKFTNEVFNLKAASPAPLPLDAGEDVPISLRSTKPVFRITFQSRDSASHSSAGPDVVLSHIAMSNVTYTYDQHPYWGGGQITSAGVVSLGVTELATGGGCVEIGDSMHLLYTVYHPYAAQPSISFTGNPVLPTPPVPVLTGGHSSSGTAGALVDTTLAAHCAYIVTLGMSPKLTNG
ncbi:MAG: hypothetical protein ABI912_08050, partial [Actinomycetota bacterium]